MVWFSQIKRCQNRRPPVTLDSSKPPLQLGSFQRLPVQCLGRRQLDWKMFWTSQVLPGKMSMEAKKGGGWKMNGTLFNCFPLPGCNFSIFLSLFLKNDLNALQSLAVAKVLGTQRCCDDGPSRSMQMVPTRVFQVEWSSLCCTSRSLAGTARRTILPSSRLAKCPLATVTLIWSHV